MTEFHGWQRIDPDSPTLYIGNLPGRKSVCVYVEENGILDVISFIPDRDKAFRLVDLIDSFIPTAKDEA